MDVDYSGLVDEIGTELVEFFDELSRFPDLTPLQQLDYVDLFTSQKFTLIDALKNATALPDLAKVAVSRSFVAVSAIMEIPEVIAAYNSGNMTDGHFEKLP